MLRHDVCGGERAVGWLNEERPGPRGERLQGGHQAKALSDWRQVRGWDEAGIPGGQGRDFKTWDRPPSVPRRCAPAARDGRT